MKQRACFSIGMLDCEMTDQTAVVRIVLQKFVHKEDVQRFSIDLNAVMKHIDYGPTIICFRRVEYFSAYMINVFVRMRTECASRHRIPVGRVHMRFCDMKPEVFQVFAVLGLTELFPIDHTEQQALERIVPPRPVQSDETVPRSLCA